MHINGMTWVVVFDSITCRILEYTKHNQLRLIKEFIHPENKLRDYDSTSDKPGSYQFSGARGSFIQETDPKEVKIERFMREIANELEYGRNTQQYQQIIIIAADHNHGHLLKQLNKHVKKLIFRNIEKDLVHQSEQQLLKTLQTESRFVEDMT